MKSRFCFVLASCILLLFTGISNSSIVDPQINLSPKEGSVGDWVRIDGRGFPAETHVAIIYEDWSVDTEPTPVPTYGSGEFHCFFQVPASPHGGHNVIASDGKNTSKPVKFFVKPKIRELPDAVRSGVPLIIAGSGFYSNEKVEVIFSHSPEVSVQPVAPAVDSVSLVGTTSMTVTTRCRGEFRLSVSFSLEVEIRPVTVRVKAKEWEKRYELKVIPLLSVLPLPLPSPMLENPGSGTTDQPLRPTFVWSEVTQASRYEFQLSKGRGTDVQGYYIDPLIDKRGDNALAETEWQCDTDLEYSTTYHWHVRAKKQGDRLYYYLVETYYPEGYTKPRQRVVRYLGVHPPRGRQRGLRGTK